MENLSDRQRHLVDNPEWSLMTCLNTLNNAMRIFKAISNGSISPDIFSNRMILVNEEDQSEKIVVNPATNPMPAVLIAENIMNSVAATCFMQFDELARQRFNGKGRFKHLDDDIRNTLSVLYLVRCGYAHNPLIPTWLIDSRFTDREFDIPAIGLHLDTTGLSRTVGVISHLNGWVGAIKLLQHAHRIIAPELARSMDAEDATPLP